MQASGDVPPGATATARATDISSDSDESDSQATPVAKSGKTAVRRDPDRMQDILLDTPAEPIKIRQEKTIKVSWTLSQGYGGSRMPTSLLLIS